MKWISYLLISFFVFIPAAQAKSQSGYGYLLKKYFSTRKANTKHYSGSPRSLSIYGGGTLTGKTKNKSIKSLSTKIIGFDQRLQDYPALGDLNIKTELNFITIQDKPVTVIQISPTFSTPDIRSGFPLYVGAGAGVGLSPDMIIESKMPLFLNAQIFSGIRFVDWYKNAGFKLEVNMKMETSLSELDLRLEVIGLMGLVFSF